MLLALTDRLRCTGPHADSWLVARADAVAAGRMIAGVLGCPVCRAERPVRGGVVYWSPGAREAAPATGPDAGADRVMRTGALLAFAEGGAPYVLCGDASLSAAGVAGLAEAPLVLLDPPDDRAAAYATIIRGAPGAPFAPGGLRGIALSSAGAAEDFMASCVRALAPRGRLVAPAGTPVPEGIRELARDAEQWVGEREPAPVTVPLARAGRQSPPSA